MNLSWTAIDIWRKFPHHSPGVPYSSFVMLVCSVAVMVNRWIPRVYLFGLVLTLLAASDTGHIIYQQFVSWWFMGRELYINELMVKKFSMLGSMVMVLVNDPFFKQTIDSTTKALHGLIAKDEPRHHISRRTSVILLIVRLLISSLFLFVGYGEITRQLRSGSSVSHGGHGHAHGHQRPDGDGHNQMWLKVLQFSLCLPFVVGWKTYTAGIGLAMCLITEALVYWRWWDSNLGLGYSYHAHDHFTVNVGVAGGLILLSSFGAGKFSVDAMLKKTE